MASPPRDIILMVKSPVKPNRLHRYIRVNDAVTDTGMAVHTMKELRIFLKNKYMTKNAIEEEE